MRYGGITSDDTVALDQSVDHPDAASCGGFYCNFANDGLQTCVYLLGVVCGKFQADVYNV